MRGILSAMDGAGAGGRIAARSLLICRLRHDTFRAGTLASVNTTCRVPAARAWVAVARQRIGCGAINSNILSVNGGQPAFITWLQSLLMQHITHRGNRSKIACRARDANTVRA